MTGNIQVEISVKKDFDKTATGQKEIRYYKTAENSCQKDVFGRMYGKCPIVMLLQKNQGFTNGQCSAINVFLI